MKNKAFKSYSEIDEIYVLFWNILPIINFHVIHYYGF